jgi:alpha-methylacyl-CoA racemase
MQHDSRTFKPLNDLQIVSLAINLPGPVAAARLRDLGATVRKVEPPDGDPLMRGCAEWYHALHEDIAVVCLDLKESDGRQQLSQMLSESDLLLTSSRLAALERLGLAWQTLHAKFPRLCHVAIIGHDPPNEEQPGHDLTYQASHGLVDPPHLPRALLADMGGADNAVTAAMALLLARERGHGAQIRHVSLSESAARHAAPLQYGLTANGGLLGGGWPGYNLYRAAEGWIAVAALEPHFAERLVRELGIVSLSYELLSEAFRTATAKEWEDWALARDLPIQAVRASGAS